VGLVAYWPLNEDASSGDVTAEDWTGRGNNLTSNNSVLSAAGKIGNAREFVAANSEYLSAAGANNDLKFTDGRDWTIAGWINVTTWTNNTYFIANDSASNRELLFVVSTSQGNRIDLQFPGTAFAANAGTNMATGVWHFFAFSYNAATRSLLARVNNGVGANQNVFTLAAGAFGTSAQPLNLGRRQFTGANAHFNGLLDEVAKWDRVLSSAELDTLYNSGNGIDLRT
jgi:hypothetical protein